MLKKCWVGLVFAFLVHSVNASLIIPIYSTNTGAEIGEIKADDTIYGLLLTPHLHGLRPGVHGFHVDTCPMCSARGLAASGHFDPDHYDIHNGPYRGGGHLGDLPVLIANGAGQVTLPVLAPRLKLETIKNHALVINAFGDNYSDTPKVSGGGGARVACGVIPFFN